MIRLVSISAIFCAAIFISCGRNDLPPGGSGLIEATEVVVSAETAGRLLALHVDNGDSLAGGDTLGVIDTATIILRLQQLEALQQATTVNVEISQISREQADQNLELVAKEYNRAKTLIKTGSVNQQQYDQAENAFTQAELSIRQAEAALKATKADLVRIKAEYNLALKQYGDCFPRAPFSGRVVDKYVDPGELLAPGKAIVKIARLDTVFVKIYLPPTDLTRIKLGDQAEVDPEDGQNQPLTGFINWIASEAEFSPKNVQTKEARADLLYAVKVKIPNPEERLKIGMPVMVTIK
jgi:HlyD family secretion protein